MNCARPKCVKQAYIGGICVTHYGKRAKAGMTRRVPASEVTGHLRALFTLGWTEEDIHRASGVAHDTLYRVLGNRKARAQATVQQDTARRLLALPLTQRDKRRVSAIGVIRRSRALARQGWPMGWQAEQCGLYTHTLRHINYRASDTVSMRTHRLVAELFDRVGMEIGPDKHTASMAANKGWLPPLAWDDDIDDPTALPVVGSRGGRRAR